MESAVSASPSIAPAAAPARFEKIHDADGVPFWSLHARPCFIENAALTLGMAGATLAVISRVLVGV